MLEEYRPILNNDDESQKKIPIIDSIFSTRKTFWNYGNLSLSQSKESFKFYVYVYLFPYGSVATNSLIWHTFSNT